MVTSKSHKKGLDYYLYLDGTKLSKGDKIRVNATTYKRCSKNERFPGCSLR